jgi:hypothetical protein
MQSPLFDRGGASPTAAARHGWARATWWTSSIAALAILSRRQLTDFDLPWNLATGRILLATRQIPRVDDIAYTARPLRYVEVLGDALLFAVYSATGAAGLQVLCAVIGLLAVVLLHVRTQNLGSVRWLWCALGLYALSEWFIMRPVMISWLAMIVTLSLLEVHRLAPDRRGGRRALAALVPLFFAWANIHGFVALGAALALGYALYRAGARVFGQSSSRLWPAADGSELPMTIGVVGLALAAACLNTMGPRLLLGSIHLDKRFRDITEWAQPTLDYFVRQQPLLSLWFVLSLLIWLGGRDRVTGSRVPTAFSIGQVLFACALTAGAVRMFPIGAIVMAHAATSRVDVRLPVHSLAAVACAACPALAALALALVVPMERPAGFDRGYLPVDAGEFVADTHPRGRMYNFMPFGGYLALRLWPEHRVFTDGRDELAREPELIDAISRATWDAASFEALDRQFHFEWAVVSAREGEATDPALAASSDWIMLYVDDVAAVYVRRGGQNEALSHAGYRRIRHLIDPVVLLASSAIDDPDRQSDMAHDGALALAQAPDSPRAAFLAASGALASRDAEAFDAAFLHLAWLTPGHPALALLSERRRASRQSFAAPVPP